ncbi:hypothetical protein [Ideonella sp. B508-1]|uniref:hypothetical protein n=1 Tax=Ideonella sp. B508-1 TaxID=137716 RepID=UPI0003B35464|nr:hypothetical protein [Ideonella sp. B508-1]
MDRSSIQIEQTVAAAQTVMALLHDRLSVSQCISDQGDLSVIQTTVRKIEELLEHAAEYDELLRRQLERTNARIASALPGGDGFQPRS